ncbi:hypothetical protein [Steroidobacter cummioxidans]|uniref:hypothetical protein n=1 Tax=Steroidobacter cummioxidans TaxID=1803913 RepID=UPI000E31BE63|nr:hypothetical protein [Steroidobacter cummioxidans]
MDTSTLVVVFLLVIAASLASYLLSQWSSIRNSKISIGWVAISMGTTFLLVAAAIVVLTVGLLLKLRLSPNIELAERVRKSAQLDGGTAQRVLDRKEASADRGVSPGASRSIAEGRSEHRSGIEPVSALGSAQATSAQREAKSGTASQGVGLIFTEADPWAATNCVYAFNRDPADLTRWTIENECGAPVGVVFASCSKSPPECSANESTSWVYQRDGMIFPGRVQRPVTYEEETRYGSQIRYVACMVAAPVTIQLIGQSSESRSSSSWREQFEAARNSDECLIHVQILSETGRRLGRSIDSLLGGNAPGSVRSGSTSEP